MVASPRCSVKNHPAAGEASKTNSSVSIELITIQDIFPTLAPIIVVKVESDAWVLGPLLHTTGANNDGVEKPSEPARILVDRLPE